MLAMIIIATAGCTGRAQTAASKTSATSFAESCRQELGKNRFDSALQFCDAAINMSPTSPDAYFYRASIYTRRSDDAHALPDLNTAIRLDPHYYDALQLRAEVYLAARAYQNALADVDTLERLAPGYAGYYSFECEIYDAMGRYKDARRQCDLAEQAPMNASSAFLSGALFAATHGDWNRALSDSDRYIALVPGDAEAFNNRCWIRTRMNDVGGAAADCSTAMKLSGNAAYIRDARADLSFRLRKYDAAIADENVFIAAFPDSPYGFGGRCAAEVQLHELQQALADCNHALRNAKSDGYWYVLRGNVYRAQGDMARAAADYQRAEVFRPFAVEVLREEAWLALAQGKLSSAARRAHDYVIANPFDPVGHEVYGRALAALGKSNEARVQFKLAIAGYDKRADHVGRAQVETAMSGLR